MIYKLTPKLTYSDYHCCLNMYLIQILLPLYDNQKKPFPEEYYTKLSSALTSEFGGLTAYSNSPATGLWKEHPKKTVKDKIITYEIMTESIKPQWWKAFREYLEEEFKQESIIIRAARIQLL